MPVSHIIHWLKTEGERGPLTSELIRYCGERCRLKSCSDAVDTRPRDAARAELSGALPRCAEEQGPQVLPLCCVHCAELINGNPPSLSAGTEKTNTRATPLV